VYGPSGYVPLTYYGGTFLSSTGNIIAYNSVKECQIAGIAVAADGFGFDYETYAYYVYDTSGRESEFSSNYVASNAVTNCGDSEGAGILIFDTAVVDVVYNFVKGGDGVGIAVLYSGEVNLAYNSVSAPSRDGILICEDKPDLQAIVVVGNYVSKAGTEGIQNTGAGSEENGGTVIAGNSVLKSGTLDYANNGFVNEESSTGNVNQPASWNWDGELGIYPISPLERPYPCDL
jgi:hypothetical protein